MSRHRASGQPHACAIAASASTSHAYSSPTRRSAPADVVLALDVLRAQFLDPVGEEERLLERLRDVVLDGALILCEAREGRAIACPRFVGPAEDLSPVVALEALVVRHVDVDVVTGGREADDGEHLEIAERYRARLARPLREGDARIDAEPLRCARATEVGAYELSVFSAPNEATADANLERCVERLEEHLARHLLVPVHVAGEAGEEQLGELVPPLG
jgi:hypothetical protein